MASLTQSAGEGLRWDIATQAISVGARLAGEGDLNHAIAGKGKYKSARRPVHLTLTQHMHMNVVDSLPTFFIAVHDNAETFFATQFLGQALGGKQDVSSQRLVVLGQVVQGAYRLFRDHQEVHRCLWRDVVEGQYLVVLVNDISRDFPGDDLGEQCIPSCFIRCLSWPECTLGGCASPVFYRRAIQRGQWALMTMPVIVRISQREPNRGRVANQRLRRPGIMIARFFSSARTV